MPPRLIERLLGREAEPDGAAPQLESHAEPAIPELEESGAGLAPSRRQRALAPAQEIIAEALAAKVLDAWLRNRHQTLHPLTVNIRRLDPPQVTLLAQMMAIAMLAGVQPPNAERRQAAEAWLRSTGGDEQAVAALRAATDTPPPLSRTISEVQEADLASLAYVFVLCASDRHDGASRLFVDYMAVRLGLPASVVRSANRRYGH